MVEHKVLRVTGMRHALGRESVLDELEYDLHQLQDQGWEVAEELSEKKGATCGLILKRPDDYESD